MADRTYEIEEHKEIIQSRHPYHPQPYVESEANEHP